MKRLLLIVLCMLIFPWTPCQSAENVQLARMNPWVARSVATSAPSCTGDNDEELINQGDASTNSSLLNICIASKITVTANTYITEMFPYVSFYGGAADMTCSIYDESNSKPGAEIEGTSVTNSIATGAGFKTMTISPAVLLTGTSYYVVCRSLGSTAAIWNRTATGGTSYSATSTAGSCGAFGTAGTSAYYLKVNGCSL